MDLNGNNRFQVGLALTALGNLGTADMCRDLAIEVDKHLKVSCFCCCGRVICGENGEIRYFVFLILNFFVAIKWFGFVTFQFISFISISPYFFSTFDRMAVPCCERKQHFAQ